jgi:hypothetical protein
MRSTMMGLLRNSLFNWVRNIPLFWPIFFLLNLSIGVGVYGILFFSGFNYFFAWLFRIILYSYYIPQIRDFFPMQLKESITLLPPPPPLLPSIPAIVIAIGFLAISLGALFLFSGLSVKRTLVTIHGEKHHLGEQFHIVSRRFWALFGANLFVRTLIHLLLMVMWVLVIQYLGTILTLSLLPPELRYTPLSGILFNGISMLINLFILTLLFTPFFFITPVIINEERKAIGSLTQSIKLIKGHFLRVFGFSFILAVLLMAIELPLGITITFYNSFAVSPGHLTEPIKFAYALILQATIMGFTMALLPSAMATMYAQLQPFSVPKY